MALAITLPQQAASFLGNAHAIHSRSKGSLVPVRAIPTRAEIRASGAPAANKALQAAAAFALAGALQVLPPAFPAQASEFDVLYANPPTESHVLDDADVLERSTIEEVKNLLTDLETRKGLHVDVVTTRKVTSKPDVFEFADQLLEKWYPTLEIGNNKGIVLMLTAQKEGAVTGGPAFVKAAGNEILEALASENLPVLATDERYNEAVRSTCKRLVAVLDGLPDPGGPKFKENKRQANYKTRAETESKLDQYTFLFVGLLVIAFVVPMLQYFAYVRK